MYRPGVKRGQEHAEADPDVAAAAAADRIRRARRPAVRRPHDRQRPDRRDRTGPAHHPRGLQRPDPPGLDPRDRAAPGRRPAPRPPGWARADAGVAAVCRHIGRVLALAGVEPSRVLAVTVGVPTSVDADGRPLGREAYLPGLPGRALGPETGGGV